MINKSIVIKAIKIKPEGRAFKTNLLEIMDLIAIYKKLKDKNV
jgi:hypothetical protein